MAELVIATSDSIEELTAKYWQYDAAEEKLAKDYVDTVIAKGDVLIRIKSKLGHGNWMPWLIEQGISQQSAWQYTYIAERMAVISNHYPSSDLKKALPRATSIKQIIELLDRQPRDFNKEFEKLMERFSESSVAVLKAGREVAEFLREYRDELTEVKLDKKLVDLIEAAELMFSSLKERIHYDV
jgi:hypothetical protein